MDAFMNAMCYSNTTGFECSGYVFTDGTATLFINPNATHSSTSYPGPIQNICIDGSFDVTLYNGNVIESTFHSHFNSSLFSPVDQTTQSNSYPNSDLIILFQNNIYIYPYEYGIFLPYRP